MSTFTKLVAGAAGVAAVTGGAAPAAAQYYGNPYGYPAPYSPYGYANPYDNANPYDYANPYGYAPESPVNPAIGGSGYGYGYGAQSQAWVDQCAAAVAQRINGGYSVNGWDGDYGRYGTGHVVGIHSIERLPTGLRVRGVANSGMATYPYGAYPNGGYASQVPDLRFTCDVDYRGYVMNVDVGANRGYNENWTPYTPGDTYPYSY